ncbi:MAG: 3-isopropylmalate dehydratase small subunit [Methanomassiliicoccales archaeon]|nr:3-isopropylmalate dehydratase small subunit [Methanomassiliicoccales archaeon]
MARVWKYGDHVNTDLIIPGRYLDDYDITSLSKHAMEDIDPSFANAVAGGDVIVSGRNFGCGSSREQAPAVLKEKGVGAVFASSIARIFYRNAINVGLPVIISDEAVKILDAGDEVELDLKSGTLTRKADGVRIDFEPLPPFLLEILESGGLVSYMKRKLAI